MRPDSISLIMSVLAALAEEEPVMPVSPPSRLLRGEPTLPEP